MPRYIDADALLEKAWDADTRIGYVQVVDVGDVIDAPTISPDEVRGAGKWEQKEVFSLDDTTIEQMQSARCSSCGKYHTTPFSYYFSKYNYCPSCGARMKGGAD
jgi:hypothetical protein